MSDVNYHYSVLLKETIEGLKIKEDGIYVDMTLGRGGHSSEILARLGKRGLLISLDQDDDAISFCKGKFSKISGNCRVIKSNFRNIDLVLKELNIEKVDGIVFDLGVSSPQFDDSERGFSYKEDAVLDMRMNQEDKLTAYYIVNNYSLNELCRVFREYGEDKYYYSIAKNIVKERSLKEIKTTSELVEIIKKSKPAKELKKPGHPVRQIFQALRIEVNDELGALKEALNKSIQLLEKNGRIAVISFQPLEDKIVKDLFNSLTKVEGNRLNFDTDIKNPGFISITKKPIVPSSNELEENHRSRTAKLRIIEKIR